ncbi:uncharacterized protein LOC142610086 isoform X2 [Castanea sativa]|uniref:uncharacterized protein LOC142610086 isoform X2 n=1 Tax=Castanea sativa TaxID=21020 RepID=UPI003F64ACFA
MKRTSEREMGSKLEISVQMRKIVITSIKTCYRSVCNHPFLVGLLCFLLFLYRSFPFIFSILVSASPVLFCTAVLLGTLLSFGQPHIPEIEKDEYSSHAHDNISSLKAGVSGDTSVVVDNKNESFVVERYAGKGGDIVEEEAIEGACSVEDKVGKAEFDDGFVDYVPLLDENGSLGIQSEKRVIEEVDREFHGLELEKKREIYEKSEVEGLLSEGEALENQYFVVPNVGDEILELGGDETQEELVDAHKRGHLDLSRNDGDGDGDGDGNGDGSSDSGSDLAESSSPDASMADFMPMLDELHPLLDLEAPQPIHTSHDESDVASERSHKNNNGSVESEEELENHGEVEDGVDENEDEEEEEAQGGKEDESKSAIKWTEDDEKNLMDLGTSELERNQRLENLISRRRARKNMRLVAEKNLIDLDGADLPFNVPHISTVRSNPFDLPYDSYTPPGSAPSRLVPRRNPFDLPYDPNEEKPDLKGDSFQHEFMTSHQKDTLFFRRHESFSLGPSVLGSHRQERHDIKFRPYFVPEHFASEGTSYPLFERQSSEISESKLSSIPDTESVISAADQDDKKINEKDFGQETELIYSIDHVSDHVERGSQSSEDVDSLEIEPVEQRDRNEVEIILGQVENHSEMDPSSVETGGAATPLELNIGETHFKTEPVGEAYSSRSSLSSLSEIDEKIPDVIREASTNFEPRSDDIEESGSSMQPSLEVPDFRFMSGEVDENQHEPVYDSSPSADKGPELHGASIVNDVPNHEEMHAASSQAHPLDEKEPRLSELQEFAKDDVLQVESSGVNVGDQNGSVVPQSVVKLVSVDSSSSSPDIGSVEEEGMAYEKESFPHEQDQVSSLSVDSEIPVGFHQDVHESYLASENLISSRIETEPAERHAIGKEETLKLEQDQIYSSSSLDYESVGEGSMHKDVVFQPEQDQVQSSSFDDAEIHIGGQRDGGEKLDSVISPSQHIPFNYLSSSVSEEQPSLATEQVTVSRTLSNHSTSETECMKDHPSNEEEIIQFEQDKVQSLSPVSDIDAGPHHDLNVKVISLGYSGQYVPSGENPQCELEKHLPYSDKSMVEAFVDRDEHRESSSILAKSTEVVRIIDNGDVTEVHDTEDKSLPDMSSLVSDSTQMHIPAESPDSNSHTGGVDLKADILEGIVNEDQIKVSEDFSYLTEAYGSHVSKHNINEEADEIKEIDEGLLSELDTVGDFSVKEVVGESLHSKLIPEETNVGSTDFDLLPKDSKSTLPELDLPALEARSLVDIDLAFKQLREGVDVEEVILPSMIDDWLVVEESNDHVETNSNLKVVDTRSLEDIDIALKQVSDVNLRELPEVSNSKDQSASVETYEVDSAKETKLSDTGFGVEETSAVAADDDHVETNSNLKVVDAKSLEDIHIVLKQVSEINLRELPEFSDSKDQSASVETFEVGSAKEIESSDVGPGVEEISAVAADKLELGSDETSENSSSNIHNTLNTKK